MEIDSTPRHRASSGTLVHSRRDEGTDRRLCGPHGASQVTRSEQSEGAGMCTTQTRSTGADGRGLCQLVPTKPPEASPSAMIAPALRPVSSVDDHYLYAVVPQSNTGRFSYSSTRPFSHCFWLSTRWTTILFPLLIIRDVTCPRDST